MIKPHKITRHNNTPKFFNGVTIDGGTKLNIRIITPLSKPKIPLRFFSDVHNLGFGQPYEFLFEEDSNAKLGYEAESPGSE